MIGIGAANIGAGLFQGFPVSTSGSRTAVADQAGSRSQVTGVVGAVVITLVLVLFPSLMQYVPQPTLGAIVIAAALSLVDVRGTLRLWQQKPQSKDDAAFVFLQHFDGAEEQFKLALTKDPNYGPAYREWAETDYRWATTVPAKASEKIKEAVEHYKKYLSLNSLKRYQSSR